MTSGPQSSPNSLILEKYSLGVGDRFAHQARAQLRACMMAEAQGLTVVPVWNKSNREHNIVGSKPESVRAAADSAVTSLGWKHSYYVDADHINLTTVDGFLKASDFFTLDVADAIGKPAQPSDVHDFVRHHHELLEPVALPGINQPLHLSRTAVEQAALKYLFAVKDAGRIYRHLKEAKGSGFITEVSMDETDSPQTPAELLVILAAIGDEQIPIQTIAPKFTGRFNKGVDYVGNPEQFEREFREDIAVIAHAVTVYGLPANLKLSIHSGSDKFSIYGAIRRTLKSTGAGVHVKTAGTTWLEELIGLAEAGGDGLVIAKQIYAEALAHRDELCAPYLSVIDIDPAKLPGPDAVKHWTSEQYVSALRHDQQCPEFNLNFRQLLHVGYKIAAHLGKQYLDMLDACEDTIARNVTDNLFERHLKPLFLAHGGVQGTELAAVAGQNERSPLMAFINDDFLLHSGSARQLYHEFAKSEPILDYHCHLSPKDIATNRQFNDLYEIWLEGDHYKWRAMRANGVPEKFCTGDVAPFEKFSAWAHTVPQTLRNPLYHWTHLELKRYFGIDETLDGRNAQRIWDKANAALHTEELRAQGILRKFHVRAVCTTDDPTDDLKWHKQIASSSLETRIYPTFRPDKALKIDQTESFNSWVDQLAAASNVHIAQLRDFLDALRQRHDYFHEVGGRLSDHGLNYCYADFCTETVAANIFAKARAKQPVSSQEQHQFAAFMMLYFGQLNAEKDWTQQLHLGALRNANANGVRKLGPDTGFDSIGDWPQADALAKYLDRLDQDGALSRTVIYNLNPADNYVFASMAGNFQDGSAAGKIQFGSGWWFLDQKEAMQWQINALSNVGLLSRFIGMLTDSRSFMSYPRHEYFRRVLCNLLGDDIERGELPDDIELVGNMVRNICFQNARQYLGLDVGEGLEQSAGAA